MKPRAMNCGSSTFVRRLAALLAGALAVACVSVAAIQAPGDWTAIGGAPTRQGDGLTIPGGAQILRSVASTVVEVRVVSRPYFSAVPADWAALEVGPAILTFVRESGGGGLLLLGDTPLALPFALPLDAAGRSRLPLDFILRFDALNGRAVLSINQATYDVDATAPAGPVEIVLSAGRSQPWSLDRLEVELPVVGSGQAGAAGATSAHEAASPSRPVNPAEWARAFASATAEASRRFMAGDDVMAEKILTDAARNPRNSPEWHLESANALTQQAFALSRAGRPDKAIAIAQRALEHTEKATRKAARRPESAALAANAEELAGFIKEKLLADHAGAKVQYLRAAARHPRGGAARELDRLEQVEIEAGRRGTRN